MKMLARKLAAFWCSLRERSKFIKLTKKLLQLLWIFFWEGGGLLFQLVLEADFSLYLFHGQFRNGHSTEWSQLIQNNPAVGLDCGLKVQPRCQREDALQTENAGFLELRRHLESRHDTIHVWKQIRQLFILNFAQKQTLWRLLPSWSCRSRARRSSRTLW